MPPTAVRCSRPARCWRPRRSTAGAAPATTCFAWRPATASARPEWTRCWTWSGCAARRRAGGFSLGMSQRLGIAAALLGDPPVLLLDEPVNGLDPEGVLWIRTLLKSLAAEGRTVLLSSHLMSEMAQTADRLIIIGRGRLIAETTMAEFLAAGSASSVTVRSPQTSAL